jgi:hypothetical protein
MQLYTIEEGEKLVKAARQAIELYISTNEFKNDVVERTLSDFMHKQGVFVTLSHYPTNALQGCIGFIEGIKPLKQLLVEAAIAAATEDPRFVPVSKRSLEHIVIEVSILTEPELLHGDAERIRKQIKIGRDGLIIEYGYHKGLLLPIVAVDEKWGVERFLDNVCLKAGLEEHKWRQGVASIYRFSTQVFREKEPNGSIEEVKLERL